MTEEITEEEELPEVCGNCKWCFEHPNLQGKVVPTCFYNPPEVVGYQGWSESFRPEVGMEDPGCTHYKEREPPEEEGGGDTPNA